MKLHHPLNELLALLRQAGFAAPADDLEGQVRRLDSGDAEERAAAARAILEARRHPARQAVVLNAGAAIMIAGRAADLREGMELACRSLATGAAVGVLERFVAGSQGG